MYHRNVEQSAYLYFIRPLSAAEMTSLSSDRPAYNFGAQHNYAQHIGMVNKRLSCTR